MLCALKLTDLTNPGVCVAYYYSISDIGLGTGASELLSMNTKAFQCDSSTAERRGLSLEVLVE